MNKSCYRAVSAHLKSHLVPGSRLLLGISGGPDSTALLHLLLEAQKHFPFDLALAYVDHGWRESLDCKWLESYDLPVYKTSLSLDQNAPNAEDVARRERYAFFLSLQEKYDVLVLGHHKGDLAETVLKRILEGASLPKLYGMKPVDTSRGIVVWRPLLSVTKEEILDYLGNSPYSIDPTNDDLRFLRARMRKSLFSELEAGFGKGVVSPLCRIAETSADLEAYLERRCKKYWDHFSGGVLDLAPLHPIENVELFFFIKALAAKVGATASKENLDTIGKMIKKRVSGKRVQVGDLQLLYERQKLKTNLFSYDRMTPSALAVKN